MPRYPQTERLLAEMTRVLRGRGYSVRTQDTYVRWAARFMRQSGHPHPGSLDQRHVESFLNALANESRLSPKTRNQAASALAFLYREVLHSDAVRSVKRAKGRSRVPTVLSHREVCAVLAELTGQKYLVAALMYGTGLRVSEALSLRIKDLDFDMARIVVHDGKGGRGRVVMLPEVLVHGLTRQVRRVRAQHERDLARGGGWAPLPDALATKKPSEGFAPGWQYLFPARKLLRDPVTRRVGRGPLHPSAVQRAVRSAVRRAGILKPATCHTFRHSFATQLLRNRYDIRVVQELLGHKDIRTTMIYLHVADQAGAGVRSPLDEDPQDRRSGTRGSGGEGA